MGPVKWSQTTFTESDVPIVHQAFQGCPTQRGVGAVGRGQGGQGGACWAFNKGICSRKFCKFRHECSMCGARNALVHCGGGAGVEQGNTGGGWTQNQLYRWVEASRDLQQKTHMPVKWDRLEFWLGKCGKREDAEMLKKGFEEGRCKCSAMEMLQLSEGGFRPGAPGIPARGAHCTHPKKTPALTSKQTSPPALQDRLLVPARHSDS